MDPKHMDMAREASRPILLPGVHAYAEKSIAAGGVINFRVSSDVPYTLSAVRLGRDTDGPSQDETLLKPVSFKAHQQPIAPGSYVNIDEALPSGLTLTALTLECWVRLWSPSAWQGLITQYTWPDRCGFGLFVDPAGLAAIYLGDGGQFNAAGLKTGPRLDPATWHHVAGEWEGQRLSLWIDGQRRADWPLKGPVRPGGAPLRLGAYGDDGKTMHVLDGDLAVPAIYGRALTNEELQDHYGRRGLLRQTDVREPLAFWPFNEERGDIVSDSSGNGHQGRIINHATWMIGGPNFDATAVPRFHADEPLHQKGRGHALRFASDDIYDCRWDVTYSCRIPEDARPGVYVGRIAFGAGHFYDVTFIVRRAPHRRKAPLVVLCSTNTWLAYNSTPFAYNWPGQDPRHAWTLDGRPSPAGAPAYSLYRKHAHDQPTYHVGLNLPWPAAGPYILYGHTESNYSHLLRAERFAHIWLEDQGFDFDVMSDLDLHANPQALQGHDVLLINGHSEYWSIPAYEAVKRFLSDGGRVVVLSGNTMFWRVSFDETLGVMECRKLPVSIGGQTDAPGEIYHSDDGRRGGLMRENGHPASTVIGVEFAGYTGTRTADFDVYRCERPEHILFNSPRPVGLGRGEAFGGAADRGLPRAVGHEWDVRITSNAQINEAYKLPDEPPGIQTLARCQRDANATDYVMLWDYVFVRRDLENATISEIIYWERPDGGRLFCVGSIGAGWGLSADMRLQTLLHNALYHFGIRPSRR